MGKREGGMKVDFLVVPNYVSPFFTCYDSKGFTFNSHNTEWEEIVLSLDISDLLNVLQY